MIKEARNPILAGGIGKLSRSETNNQLFKVESSFILIGKKGEWQDEK
jgi:hypothetical protein